MAEPITELPDCIARPVQGPSPMNPLTDEHFLQIRMAVKARRPVAAAAKTARFSANSTLAIGLLGIPVLLFSPSLIGFLMVTGICTIGVIERSGARRLRLGQPSAAAFLGRNQLAFLGLIVAYCIFQMVTFSGTEASAALMSKETRSALAQLPGQDIVGQMGRLGPDGGVRILRTGDSAERCFPRRAGAVLLQPAPASPDATGKHTLLG